MTERGDRITFARIKPLTAPTEVGTPLSRWPPQIPVEEVTVELPGAAGPPLRDAWREFWQERMREEAQRPLYFDTLWARTPTPPRPWWRRLRDRAAYRVYTMRDRLAFWIAPWRGDE